MKKRTNVSDGSGSACDSVSPSFEAPLERSGNTRRPIERIFAIHQSIQRRSYPNCRSLAEEIGVTQKTIQRDVTFMQRDLGLPLVYDEIRRGYRYSRPVGDLPFLCHDVEDVVALFLARRALEPLRGTAFEASLRESFQRMAAAIPGAIAFRWNDLDEAFSVRESGVVPGDASLFRDLVRAVLEGRMLRFEYRKLDGEAWEPRKLCPYHLAEFDGGWYVIGHDPDRSARRTFATQRMRSVQVTDSKFLRPADFCPEAHLGGSFGVWDSPANRGDLHRIVLRFSGWAARVVSERRWHPSQELRWLGEGEESLEMSLELSGFEEISRWILSWGRQVEVMEPGFLRDKIASSLSDALDFYGRG